MRHIVVLTLAALLLAGYAAQVTSAEPDKPVLPPAIGVPSLEVRASWPEQQIATNYIHKMRVPRGGTIDITATIDPAKAVIRPSTVSVAASGGLVPIKATIDGKEVSPPAAAVPVDLSQKRQVCWTFQVPWELRAAQKDYRFDVAVVPSGRARGMGRRASSRPAATSPATRPALSPEATGTGGGEIPQPLAGTLKASVTVESGMSCYDTTVKPRLDLIAKSPYCKFETIGKTILGRDMYLLRITDWTVPAKDKKQFIVIGPQHGDEPSGVEATLDFAWELVSKPENKDYLQKVVVYIVPSHNPDGHELCTHQNRHAIDVGNYGYAKLEEPESVNVHGMLMKYAPEFTDALCLVHHQWGSDYTLLSYLDSKPAAQSASWQLMQNIAIRATNNTGRPMYPTFGMQLEPYTGIRGFLIQKMGIPNFTVEDTGHSVFNLGETMPNIVNQLAIDYAVLDQLCDPRPVKPKAHPTSNVKLPAERTFKVYKTDKPPTLDGKLDEPCWSRDAVITSPARQGEAGNTKVLACYDDSNLYLAFKADDWEKSPTTAPAAADEPGKHDGCEIMLDTNFNRWTYYRLQADTAGAFGVDYHISPGFADMRPCQTNGIKVATSTDGGAIEICIPFAALNHAPELDGPPASPPADGSLWGVNFTRNARGEKPEESWTKFSDSNPHRPGEFNAILFAGKLPEAKP